jgi:hypothetical protein
VGHAGEALADLLLGHVDAVELDPDSPYRLRSWYQLLNAGLRVPLVGASAKASNRTPLGAYRTYARCPAGEPFSYAAWIDAVRAGRTFVTAAPFVTFQIEGFDPGAEVEDSQGRFKVRFGALGAGPGDQVDLVANGSMVASSDGTDREHEVTLPAGGWVAVRCRQGGQLQAHTSPVFVRVPGSPAPVSPTAIVGLDRHLVRAREWVESEGRFANPKSRTRLLDIFDTARKSLAARVNPADAPP